MLTYADVWYVGAVYQRAVVGEFYGRKIEALAMLRMLLQYIHCNIGPHHLLSFLPTLQAIYIHVYVCVYIYIYIYLYVWNIYIHTCIHTYIFVYVYMIYKLALSCHTRRCRRCGSRRSMQTYADVCRRMQTYAPVTPDASRCG
jgi:hypothetical protein